MEMKIGFDPSTLKYNDEAYPAFEAGGITLTFWTLYKKHFITNQYFKDSLEKMGELFEKMFNKEESEVQPYDNIDEFILFLSECGLFGGGYMRTKEHKEWVIKYWDYFNLNVQRQLTITYDAVETVKKVYRAS